MVFYVALAALVAVMVGATMWAVDARRTVREPGDTPLGLYVTLAGIATAFLAATAQVLGAA